MGGGRAYEGGKERLSYHHDSVKHVMGRPFAVHWLELMRKALDSVEVSQDPRVRPCIDSFLVTQMREYGKEFNFDASGLNGLSISEEHAKTVDPGGEMPTVEAPSLPKFPPRWEPLNTQTIIMYMIPILALLLQILHDHFDFFGFSESSFRS
mmetsp:Transcript_44989/g.70543  ORF Transcript_44989/g.70543 Transcript_44989/m.70543 type:complete len:152 (-) Transcript_44989:816-1271(-)